MLDSSLPIAGPEGSVRKPWVVSDAWFQSVAFLWIPLLERPAPLLFWGHEQLCAQPAWIVQ
jgi:hypothetical protein